MRSPLFFAPLSERSRSPLSHPRRAPFAKTGGLADVVSALGRALHRRGHDVRIFLPLYGSVGRGNHKLTSVEELQAMEIEYPARAYPWRGLHGNAAQLGAGGRNTAPCRVPRLPGALSPRRVLHIRSRRSAAVGDALSGGARSVDSHRVAGRCGALQRLAHGAPSALSAYRICLFGGGAHAAVHPQPRLSGNLRRRNRQPVGALRPGAPV